MVFNQLEFRGEFSLEERLKMRNLMKDKVLKEKKELNMFLMRKEVFTSCDRKYKELERKFLGYSYCNNELSVSNNEYTVL